MLAALMAIACPVIWYFIGRHDGYAKGREAGDRAASARVRTKVITSIEQQLALRKSQFWVRVETEEEEIFQPVDLWIGDHKINPAAEAKH